MYPFRRAIIAPPGQPRRGPEALLSRAGTATTSGTTSVGSALYPTGNPTNDPTTPTVPAASNPITTLPRRASR